MPVIVTAMSTEMLMIMGVVVLSVLAFVGHPEGRDDGDESATSVVVEAVRVEEASAAKVAKSVGVKVVGHPWACVVLHQRPMINVCRDGSPDT